jgi:midasin
VSLTERGDSESIERHPDFRLFACMNPPTDFGKKDLPPAIRSRFNELYVADIDDREDLEVIVCSFLDKSHSLKVPVDRIVELYVQARGLAKSRYDSHFSNHPNRPN